MAGEANIWNPRSVLQASADSLRVEESFIAAEGQVLFVLTTFTYELNSGALEVFKNGLFLTKGEAWIESSESSFYIMVPCTAGDKIDVVGFTAITAESPNTNGESYNISPAAFVNMYAVENVVAEATASPTPKVVKACFNALGQFSNATADLDAGLLTANRAGTYEVTFTFLAIGDDEYSFYLIKEGDLFPFGPAVQYDFTFFSGSALTFTLHGTVTLEEGESVQVMYSSAAGEVVTISYASFSMHEIVPIGFDRTVSVPTMADLLAANLPNDLATITMLGFHTPGDGGGGKFYWDASSVATHNVGTVVKPTTTVGAGRWLRVFDPKIVNVKWFGARSDGTGDVTDAFQAAFDFVDAAGGGVVYIPAGEYLKDDAPGSGWTMYSNTTLRGDGDCSVIHFDDKASVARSGNDMLSCSNTTDVCFQNFKVLGTALTELTQTNQKQCIRGIGVTRLRMQGVTISGPRYVAASFGDVNGGIFTGNALEYSVRDGIRATNSWNIIVTGNTFKCVSDDAVSLHSVNDKPVPGSGFIVSNNTFEGCQGIKVLGAKICSITNNVFRRSLRTPIHIEIIGDYPEGSSPMFAINVSGNIITDTFQTLGTNRCIFIEQSLGRFDDGLATMPSVTSDSWPYTYLQGLDGTTMPTIGQFSIKVSNNIISRTLGATAAYSDFGYGELFDRETAGFFSDPAITDSTFGATAIHVTAPMMGLDITGNNISGCSSGQTAVILRAQTSTNILDFSNVRVDGNTIFNCPGTGISIPDTGSGVAAKDIHITNNILDLDPFFISPYHNSDNTWTSSGFVTGLDVDGATGLHISGNTFKNMGETGLSATEALTTHPNLIYGDYVAVSDDASNKGIRRMPINAAANVVIKIDGDPASGTYGQTVTVPYPYADAMPSSGYYFRGTYVNKINPGIDGTLGSQYIMRGWFRVTTGNSHTLNTDWIESRILTGT